MIGWFFQKLIGTQNERALKRLWPVVERVNACEADVAQLSDDALRGKTAAFRTRIAEAAAVYERELADAQAARADQVADEVEERKRQTRERRQRQQAVLDEILPEAFAVVREMSKRVLKMRHFDVQLIGGMILHDGTIAEMATGEGKTLVATLAAYLNALTGRGVHIVTVNDYLAKRDAQWMGPLYHALGLSVGVIQGVDPAQPQRFDEPLSFRFDPAFPGAHERFRALRPVTRQDAYAADITYGTNNEFGFDYLRDNMRFRREDLAQREHHFAIVDEVDSILIDEARTPLIISGPAEESTELYYRIDQIIPKLAKDADYEIEEKTHTVALTEDGIKKAERLLGVENLYDDLNMQLVHHIHQALRAHNLYKRDVDYMVKDEEIIIVDEFTGRLMPGRRWSDGLHQAIEAKERCRIREENQTLATITFQNYFRMYEKLAGMTGTAATEANEFKEIYELDVVVVPTNQPLGRTNYPDVIYRTEKEKFNASADEIAELYEAGRPVLVGTISIEKSERLSGLLKRRGILHHVLNAKYHEMEAEIVSQAGRFKAVTIATNMAGRGTDILLGGNPAILAEAFIRQQETQQGAPLDQHTREQMYARFQAQCDEEHAKVVQLGGLHVLGTERHEARRIDNQLRGRSGRQGDPGSSRFYLALEDDLMRIFASERIEKLMDFFKWEENEPIEHGLISKSIETAQKRVEAHNFEIRKQLLEYDNVMNRQREVIYEERRRLLEGEDLRDHLLEMLDQAVEHAVDVYAPKDAVVEQWDLQGFAEWIHSKFGVTAPLPHSPGNMRSASGSNEETKQQPISSSSSASVPESGAVPMPQRTDDRAALCASVQEALRQTYEAKEQAIGSPIMRGLERSILLQTIDAKWKDHLYAMDYLREGIGLRAYGQRDPLVEYQHEAFEMFEAMKTGVKEEALEFLFKVRLAAPTAAAAAPPRPAPSFDAARIQLVHPEVQDLSHRVAAAEASGAPVGDEPSAPPPVTGRDVASAHTPVHRDGPKVGRNEPCPCGSGKKYKKCHGA